MKTIKLIIVFVLFVNTLQAKSKNILLDRDFWKTQPSLALIKQKIKEGHSATELTTYGFDATVYAILEKLPNTVIKHLLSIKGNHVNKFTHDKRTYVFWAAYKDNLELMEYLFANNAKTDLKDSHGYSILTFAAATGNTNTKIYDLCIENGMDLKTDLDEHGASALLLVSPYLNNFDLINYFTEKGLDINMRDNDGNGIFNYASRKGHVEFLSLLIKKGVDYKSLNKNEGNALFWATKSHNGEYNSLKFFKYLKDLGIAINITNKDGDTPLHNIAYRNNSLKTLNYFLNEGLDVNQTDKDGNTSLISASGRNTLDIISKLEKNTKNINHLNKDGHSALTKAMRNSTDVIRFLIEKGANVHVVDNKGNNLAYYLFKSFDKEKQEDFNTKLMLLSKNGFNIKTSQKNGNTLFHLAVESNNIDLLKYVNASNII